MLSGGEYARIKTETKPHVGKEGEPVAEYTKLGWFIMSPGEEFDRSTMLMTQTSQTDYEELCRLDVLGLADSPTHDQETVYSEFKEQLTRDPAGWYETGLPWRGNHASLPNNKQGSLRRLNHLTKRLHQNGLTTEYDSIIREQLNEGIVESAPDVPSNKEFYIPHKAVVKESAASTKTRIVYDASAKARPDAPSLNECLNPGPPLQNKLWDVLVQQRAYPVVVAADIRKAFLQIRIRENERDSLRFHWQKEPHSEIEVLRFTRALFGLISSPFLLGGVLECHFDAWEEKYPDLIRDLRRSLYVDDLLTGGQIVLEARTRKEKSIEVLDDATFQLHKWHSNVEELERDGDQSQNHDEQSFAKQQFGVQPSETKMLGLKWNKVEDTLSINIPEDEHPVTRRGILGKLAKIYDPLGLVSPLTLEGKLVYRAACESKTPWDAKLDDKLTQRWKKWERITPKIETTPRAIVDYREPVDELELHAFGDASTLGVGAAVYSIVRQKSGVTQRLVAGKGRLAKQGLTIPRLELATNLVTNVGSALQGLPKPRILGWLDSSVALHWIRGNGQYKQFVANRVAKIQLHPEIEWRYVPTHDNPADLASRGGTVTTPLWWTGPEWLQDHDRWPTNPITETSADSEAAEAKIIKEVLCVAQAEETKTDEFDDLLERRDLRRVLRTSASILRFVRNCRRKQKQRGPLTTPEVDEMKTWWIKCVQLQDSTTPHHERTKVALNLQKNVEGLLECRGRIRGKYPTYLPPDAPFTRKLVQRIHVETLHGGVGLTMAAVREDYWIPKLRRLVKSIRRDCWGCKRSRATAFAAPPPGQLPEDRTTGETAFEVVGTDFAGPIRYRRAAKREGKAYLVIFSCSLSRAVHLEIVPNLETATFIPCLKRLVARKGRPRVIYSDNGRTFVKAAKWLGQAVKDERLHSHLEECNITWKFNLSRAPWWGGQFERLIGIVKKAMHKTIGGATLTWQELSEVMLDIETQINRRPLSYVEDDVELQTLTPSTFLFQRSNQLPEQEPWREEEKSLRKRAKFFITCKKNLWNRWRREYLTALREKHNLTHQTTKFKVLVGDVVIVKSDDKNRGNWPLAIVQRVFPGKDGVIRAVKLKTAKGTLERPVQHLYPMELAGESVKPEANTLNPDAKVFRPKRKAAEEADERIRKIAEYEQKQF